MQIEHLAVWTPDLERLRVFYETYFGATAGAKYVNAARGFESYFLKFESGARLEIMTRPVMGPRVEGGVGYAHFALSVGSREAVDAITARLAQGGVPVVSGPRQTGDGYYESVVLDPDGNPVEITI